MVHPSEDTSVTEQQVTNCDDLATQTLVFYAGWGGGATPSNIMVTKYPIIFIAQKDAKGVYLYKVEMWEVQPDDT